MKVGFIGCGNMATAIINGITSNNAINGEDVYAFDIYAPATEKLKKSLNINVCNCEKDVVSSSDIIFLAVKPNIQASVLNTIDGEIGDKLLISIAAGKTIDFIESNLKCKAKIFGVIGGCGPAFAYMFIDAMARAGVKNGMKKSDALMIAAQTVLGSAKMILESDEHPWQLIDNVCSPGGTTIEGVTSLQADGFEAAVHNAVDKALDKDKKL